jgi:hypothetical protein
MTYLVVGLDQITFAPWHQNVQARDVATARQVAVARADASGIALVVAAVIGPNSTVLDEPAAQHAAAPASLAEASARKRRRGEQDAHRPEVGMHELTERVRHLRRRLRAGDDA